MSLMVIAERRPWQRPLVLLLALLVVGGSGWATYEYGYRRAGIDCKAALAENRELTATVGQQQDRIAELREQRALLERSRQIESQAHTQMGGTISTLQDEVAELKAELAFYRGIVSPRDASRGLRVGSFTLAPAGVEHGFRYKLVLTQVMKNDTVASGDATFSVEGLRSGKHETLQLVDLAPDRQGEFRFKFKYFQNFEGDIMLPADFIPARAVVKVSPQGKKHSAFEETFEWPAEET